MNQKKMIEQMTDDQLLQSLFMSQLMLFSLAIILSMFLFESFIQWLELFSFNLYDIFYYGGLSGLLIVCVDIILMKLLPKTAFDDGGINERIFQNLPIRNIFLIALIVSISEELLFRGVLQTVFGYVIASTIFALVHFRYLNKPVLLISILLISFYIGYLFHITNNLLVTIAAHFLVDFILGLMIRYQWHEVIAR